MAKKALRKLLRGRSASLRGARILAYRLDRWLRNKLHPARGLLQSFPNPHHVETARVLAWVTAVSDRAVLARHLLASDDVAAGLRPLYIVAGARSAAEAFNPVIEGLRGPGWVVWVHQDVRLPQGWLSRFETALAEAQRRLGPLAVAGVYGVRGFGAKARRAGHVLDRGELLREPEPLPCRVDSLDELLVAVRADSGLRMDARLGFDLYATDLVLQARALGLGSAVVDAYCEHWSSTPSPGAAPAALARRLMRSAEVFEAKWASALPIQTTWGLIERVGDTARLLAHLGQSP